MITWLARYGGYALIFTGWLLFSSLLPSAAGPADALAGQLAVASQEPTRAAGATLPAGQPAIAGGPGAPTVSPHLIANPRRPREAPAQLQSASGRSRADEHTAADTTAAEAVEGSIEASVQDERVALSDGPVPVEPSPGDGTPEVPVPTDPLLPAPPLPPPPVPTDRIVIPRIGVDVKVVDVGVLPSGEMETAAFAAGRLAYSAQAGEPGNAVIAGHNDIQGAVFRRLAELQPGAVVLLHRAGSVYHYRVAQRTIVREDGATEAQRRENARWLDATDESTATLISCYPYRVDTHRIIVRATLEAGSL